MDTHPYYQRSNPNVLQNFDFFSLFYIDLRTVHLPTYSPVDSQGRPIDMRSAANDYFDGRAAAAIAYNVGDPQTIRIEPNFNWVTEDSGSGDGSTITRIYFVDTNGNLDFGGRNYDPSRDLLQLNFYGDHSSTTPENILYHLTPKCLALMMYGYYFSNWYVAAASSALKQMVSQAIMNQSTGAGWCGSLGPNAGDPDVWDALDSLFQDINVSIIKDSGLAVYRYDTGGNYEFGQVMTLIPLVYAFYDDLTPEAREKVINVLLKNGAIKRFNLDYTYTNGRCPGDYSRVGRILGYSIPETENHVLAIATARYLTNQLLYQRKADLVFDNLRNGDLEGGPSCKEQILGLLRNQLRNDFAEYNAKNYQEEMRHSLLVLNSYAYDAEVRLAAKMVLDYISAHIAVSSNDLRRMVPFRRRNEDPNSRLMSTDAMNSNFGFMDIPLLDYHGPDPMPAQFALLAGNTRAYQYANYRQWVDPGTPSITLPSMRPWDWAITPNFAPELILEAVCNYRLPPIIHDLFVNDLHRRFFQRLHRHQLDEPGQQRNCENMEIYYGSASYLISAGGKPAPWVIPGHAGHGYQAQNIGVALPISFMPTGCSAGSSISTNDSNELIQISCFSDDFEDDVSHGDHGGYMNYGVAPNFACGYKYYFPDWTGLSKMNSVFESSDGCYFINSRKSLSLRQLAGLVGLSPYSITARGIFNKVNLINSTLAKSFIVNGFISLREIFRSDIGYSLLLKPSDDPPGFYLAVIKSADFIMIESFDTWLQPEVSFQEFQQHVYSDNPTIQNDIKTFSDPVIIKPFANFQKDYINEKTCIYTTYGTNISLLGAPVFINGNKIAFIIWNKPWQAVVWTEEDYTLTDNDTTLIGAGNAYYSTGNYTLTYFYPYNHVKGSKILNIEYGNNRNSMKEAGNYDDVAAVADANQYKFLSGTIMNSDGNGLIVIKNSYLKQSLTLDWSNSNHLIRTDENGTVEQAGVSDDGKLYEVWVDFTWTGDEDGDFFHPCKTITSALQKVADGGVIKIAPGTTTERLSITKRVKIVRAFSDVVIGTS